MEKTETITWIPVSEKLPKEPERLRDAYLCTCSWESGEKRFFTIARIDWYGLNKFECFPGGWDQWGGAYEIIAWAELPHGYGEKRAVTL